MSNMIGRKVVIKNTGMTCSTYDDAAKKLSLKRFVRGYSPDAKKDSMYGVIIGYFCETTRESKSGIYAIHMNGRDVIFRHYYDRPLPFEVIETKMFSDEDFIL